MSLFLLYCVHYSSRIFFHCLLPFSIISNYITSVCCFTFYLPSFVICSNFTAKTTSAFRVRVLEWMYPESEWLRAGEFERKRKVIVVFRNRICASQRSHWMWRSPWCHYWLLICKPCVSEQNTFSLGAGMVLYHALLYVLLTWACPSKAVDPWEW